MNATGDQDLRAWLRANDHIARVSGKEYVLLSGLLALAHMHGVESQETTLLHFDMEKGVAVAVTTITGTRGTFTGHGDSTPYNTGKMVAGAFIRMAETRSVCRALRFYLGIGMTARDELPGDAPSRAPEAQPSVVEAPSAPIAADELSDLSDTCATMGMSPRLVEDFVMAEKGKSMNELETHEIIGLKKHIIENSDKFKETA
jgi:hypothetical protein